MGPNEPGVVNSSADIDVQLGRPNRFEIDLDAIAYNAATIRGLVGSEPSIFAALKGDAYGYGVLPVAQTVLSAGVDAISLVNIADAIKLRRHGVSAPILLYAGVLIDADVVAAIERYDLMPTVLDLETARLLSYRIRRELKVFVKIDVGLERLGVVPEHAPFFVASVAALPRLKVQGLYSHMHVPDRSDIARYIEWQFGRFDSAVRRVSEGGVQVPVTMIASTSVLSVSATKMNLNAIDPGLVFFGLDQHGPGLRGTGLRSAFHALKTRLIQIKDVTRTDFLGVAPFAIGGPMRVGVIPIGRYDGMDALCCGQVLVGGLRVDTLGTPTTEHTRVDLTRVPSATVGDEVIIVGRQGREEISPDEVAQSRGLSSGGMVALGIRETVQRVYLRTRD
jgi:alanine racemase